MSRNVLLLPGDGIGPEIVAEAEKVLNKVNDQFNLGLTFGKALVGGAAIDATDSPLPDETLEKARNADAILLGAVGGPQWDSLPMAKRPEKGLLGLRSNLQLFANLRPAILYPQL
ncbi:MAG: 3-isopropylmalate dehydrogenase, partial [Marinobacter sp.]|nr:3-isopropylmalate dehydrogenase [Marinobacter sp.]MDX5473648.1 3-isopropylmalate dehydrogenase [Marinobacter sp.]